MDESEPETKDYSDPAEIKKIVAEARRVLAEGRKMAFGVDFDSVKREDMDDMPMDTYAALRKAGWDG